MKEKRISGTKEWSDGSANLDLGCANGCKYCYACAAAIRYGRATPASWTKPVAKENFPGVPFKVQTLMFPTSHDITEDNMGRAVQFLLTTLAARECKVLIVSKPRISVVRRLMLDLDKYKDRIMFRFTIGSPDSKVLKFWEPGAPDYNERVACLALAYSQGWQTSVSCEPMLDFPYQMEKIIEDLGQFVTDAVWLGLMNKSTARLSMNGHKDAIPAHDKLAFAWTPSTVRAFYDKWNRHPKVKWKDSIKEIVGLPSNEKAGMDV